MQDTKGQPLTLSDLPMLSEMQRIEAQERARAVLRAKFPQPVREQFQRAVLSEYPDWLTVGAGALLVIVFLAAGNISVFRLFTAGRQNYLASIGVDWQSWIVGVSTFLLAEFLVISCVLALNVYFKGRSRWLLAPPIVLGLLMAFFGNWVITRPHSIWPWLETITPPIAVLSMSLIGERILLQVMKQRQQTEREYQKALESWQLATRDPEQHAGWKQAYANALWEQYVRAFKARRSFDVSQFTADERIQVVWREMQADDWFREPFQKQAGETPETAVTQGETSQKRATEPALAPVEQVKRHLEQHPEDRGMSLRPLADKLGVSYSTVRRALAEPSSNGHTHED